MEKKSFSFDKFTVKKSIKIYEEKSRITPIIDDVDVLVVGGSQSGVTAAIAAARNGMNVQLVERFGFLGGQSIYSMVVQWEKRAFINNQGAVLTKGIPLEILNNIVEKGGSDNLWNDPKRYKELKGGEEWLDPEAIKVTLLEMCQKENITILFHTLAVDVIVSNENDDKIKDLESDNYLPKMKGVIFENKSGRFAITAQIIIDATADLDLIWHAIGEKGCKIRDPSKRMTSGYYIWYGGIENNKFIDWYSKNPNARGGFPNAETQNEMILTHLKNKKLIKIPGNAFEEIMEKADNLNLMEKIEDILEEFEIMSNLTLQTKWVGYNRWSCEFTSISGTNMLDVWEVSKYEIFKEKIAFYMLPILRLIPGWENCYISRTSMHLGSRETRVLISEKIINEKYIFNQEFSKNNTPYDTIGRSGAHDPGKNKIYAGFPIPYGIIVPKNIDGVLVCARAVGTEFDRSLDAQRGITPNMVVAQGAGTAAALAIKDNVEARNIDLKKLHQLLRSANVQLDHEAVEPAE